MLDSDQQKKCDLIIKMYDTIVNPVSSRQVKTIGKMGKKLLHNYEDKFDYVINPETNKIVQSGGKVGQQVLKKYKQKVASTNVGGRGGKKKTKRVGGRQAPRTYTCLSDTNQSFEVECNSEKCSFKSDDNARIIVKDSNTMTCYNDKDLFNYEKKQGDKKWELKEYRDLEYENMVSHNWRVFKQRLNNESVKSPDHCKNIPGRLWNPCKPGFSSNELKNFLNGIGEKDPDTILKQSSKNSKFWNKITEIVKRQEVPQRNAYDDTRIKNLREDYAGTQRHIQGTAVPPAASGPAAPTYVDEITSSIVNNTQTQTLIHKNWTENMKSILSPTCCVMGSGINPCRNKMTDLRTNFYNNIGLSKEHIEKINKDKTFSQYFWEKVHIFLEKYYNDLLEQHMVPDAEIPDLWNNFKTSFGTLPNYSGQPLSNINPLECRIIDDVNRCTYNKKGINRCKENKKGIKTFINSVMNNDKITDIDILVNDILENQFLNMLFWGKINEIIKIWEMIKKTSPEPGEQGAAEAAAPPPAPPAASAPPTYSISDIKKFVKKITNEKKLLIIDKWNDYMKSIPDPISCINEGRYISKCRSSYGIDLREKFYKDIGLLEHEIEKIKNDTTVNKSFWKQVYSVLKNHYNDLLEQHMVQNANIPDLWNNFKTKQPNYSGQSINPLECRINNKNRCKKEIKEFINSVVVKNDKITDIKILENRFLNDLFWEKINVIVSTPVASPKTAKPPAQAPAPA